MATTNLSAYDIESVPDGADFSFSIVVAEWNIEITNALLKGALEAFEKHHVKKENIHVEYVPGSFELPLGAKMMMKHHHSDAVIILGAVIQGETRHFDFICQGVTQGVVELNLTTDIPVIYGLLTTNDKQQALDRSGGKHGNKGTEAAITALKMVALKKRLF